MSNRENKSSGTGVKIAFAAGGIIIIALLVVIVVLLLRGQKTEETKRNVVVNEANAETVAEELINEPYIAPGYYSTQMSTTWHFSKGDAVSSDAYVKNDAGNTNDVYFDVFLASDESKPILQSPIIPRGAEYTHIALDTPLNAGAHDCVVVYHLVDENQKSISTLRIAITIVVEQ